MSTDADMGFLQCLHITVSALSSFFGPALLAVGDPGEGLRVVPAVLMPASNHYIDDSQPSQGNPAHRCFHCLWALLSLQLTS